ncbi:hypothetical protein [Ideonella sp.]|uniref:hypothetical protein n=1 Tax=Ideonella sp. TaxID=1929293 RepID=UPI0035B1205A
MTERLSRHDRCVVLGRPRCGAHFVYRLLAAHVPARDLGVQPFAWQAPLGEWSRRFHADASADVLLPGLTQALEDGVFFLHLHEAESWAFNALVLDALAAAGYRVLRVGRRDEAARLLSLWVAQACGAWSQTEVQAVRDGALRGAPPTLPADRATDDAVRSFVHAQQANARWMDAELARRGLPVMVVAHEALFHDGIGVLDRANEVFAFAGAGSREAVLDDETLLRLVFTGESHTPGLVAHWPLLRRVAEVIAREVHA